MWKEFRKSWESWREKVDEALGGVVDPIQSANVSFDNTGTDLEATNVQSAITEVNDKIHGYAAPDAEHVDYDNTASELTATNVQDAIDEVVTELADKVDKVEGKGLSENDYTDADKAIVDGVTTALSGKVDKTSVGAANGVAELGADGKVLSSQLPAAVDSIVEGYYYNDKFYEEAAHTTEIVPASNVIYIDLVSEKTYRWGGTVYVEISQSLALGETSSTAYRGDRGKAAYDFSQTPYTSSPAENGTASAGSSTSWSRGDHVHPHDSTKVDKVSGKGLSANDFTDALKSKLEGIAAGAEVNVQADYAQSDSTKDDFIKNKPTVDASPTNNSNNLVKSGGVYTALGKKITKIDVPNHTKNLTITIPNDGTTVEIYLSQFQAIADNNAGAARLVGNAITNRNSAELGSLTYSKSGTSIVIDCTSNIRGFLLCTDDTVSIVTSGTSTPQADALPLSHLTEATTSANGLMSAADKSKLNVLSSGYKVTSHSIQKTASSGTIGDLAKSASVELGTAISGLANDEIIIPQFIYITGINSVQLNNRHYTNTITLSTIDGDAMAGNSSTQIELIRWHLPLTSQGTTHTMDRTVIKTDGTISITDQKAIAITESKYVFIQYLKLTPIT